LVALSTAAIDSMAQAVPLIPVIICIHLEMQYGFGPSALFVISIKNRLERVILLLRSWPLEMMVFPPVDTGP
jgi:hypothetical protein